ncbi:hypothetical protein HanRHA438_Chr16g0784791 [Helianthus annuus]|nr:hypothetical protein HanRHA438_Chr16g0784791 [Helianthus annuus]
MAFDLSMGNFEDVLPLLARGRGYVFQKLNAGVNHSDWYLQFARVSRLSQNYIDAAYGIYFLTFVVVCALDDIKVLK